MFGRSPPSGLTLELGESTLRFPSAEDFAFALAGRAGVPGSRIGSLMEMSDDALRREAEAIREVEQMFNDALDGFLREVTRISPFLKGIDLNLVSQDHDWRNIIAALNEIDEAQEPYKKVALVKYTQYLAARRQAVTAIYAMRRQGHHERRERAGNGKIRDTAIFDVVDVTDEKNGHFSRIPKGETVEVDLSREPGVPLLLAQCRCNLALDGEPVFVDDTERVTPLHAGRNIVGRDAGCDVVLNPAHRDISRKHLIIEVAKDHVVRLIDISSHGTFISPRLLESTRI